MHVQGIGVSMFSSKFSDPSDAGALQDFMVCMEMLMSAGMMWVAFPHTEFRMGGQTSGFRLGAFMHAISLQDVYSDIMHQVRGRRTRGAGWGGVGGMVSRRQT